MKKYLITGCGGFVAQHFLNLLESAKEPVSVLGVDINYPDTAMHFKFIDWHFKPVNLLDKESVYALLSEYKPDYILHLASYSSVAYSWKFPVEAFANNSNIFLNLVEQVRLIGYPSRIISVGSSEEYGKISEDQLPITEETVRKPASPYAVARVSQEMLSEIYADSYNIDIVMTRSFNHIGPGQKDIFVISSFAKKLTDIKKGKVTATEITVGNISLVRDFVDVRDVVRAYYLLFQKGRKGQVYNICSGQGFSLEYLLVKMMEMLGLSLSIRIDESLVRPGENRITKGSYKKIADEVNWQPSISIEKSLSDIIDYWMSKP